MQNRDLKGQALHNELKRRSQDIIRIHNPSGDEYVVVWDKSNTNIRWKIPSYKVDAYGVGRGNRDVPRFIAEKFMKEMLDLQLNNQARAEWNKRKKEYGLNEYTAKEEERLMTAFFRDEERIADLMEKIWVGVVQRNGDELEEAVEPESPRGRMSVRERLMEDLSLDEKEIVEENKEKLVEDLKNEK